MYKVGISFIWEQFVSSYLKKSKREVELIPFVTKFEESVTQTSLQANDYRLPGPFMGRAGGEKCRISAGLSSV